MLGRGCLCDPAPDKNLTRVPLELPWGTAHDSLLGRHVLNDPARRGPLGARIWSPLVPPVHRSPLLVFAVYLFLVVNLSHNSHFVLSPLSPSVTHRALNPMTQAPSSKVHYQGSKTGCGVRCPGQEKAT